MNTGYIVLFTLSTLKKKIMEEKENLVARLEQYLSGKIGYHILRSSLQKCSSDLNEFVKESHEFSCEQLLGIVAFSDHIKNQLEILNKELASRVEDEK